MQYKPGETVYHRYNPATVVADHGDGTFTLEFWDNHRHSSAVHEVRPVSELTPPYDTLSTLDQTCFLVTDSGEVIEKTYNDCKHYIKHDSLPTGVGFATYLDKVSQLVEITTLELDESGERIVREEMRDVWVKVRYSFGKARVAEHFDCENDARSAVNSEHIRDILYNSECEIFANRQVAEDYAAATRGLL
jgi:hypothetical protein